VAPGGREQARARGGPADSQILESMTDSHEGTKGHEGHEDCVQAALRVLRTLRAFVMIRVVMIGVARPC
jgi:hypothetical protein